MADIQNSKEQHLRQKVEEIGIFFDHGGLPPLTGRVVAYLLLSEPPHRDFFEIQEFLKASKSAVSKSLNHLMQQGTVDYITFSGDRRRYFRINSNGWINTLKTGVRKVTSLKTIMEEVLQERADSVYPAFNEGLQKMLDFNITISKGIERSIAEWDQKEVSD